MSLFGRRHYIALAQALRRSDEDDLSHGVRIRIINDVVQMLEADSDGFNRQLFLDNCNAKAHAHEPR